MALSLYKCTDVEGHHENEFKAVLVFSQGLHYLGNAHHDNVQPFMPKSAKLSLSG